MILSEAAKKYGVPLDLLCRLRDIEGLEPIGERQGKRRMLNEYEEKELLDAILADYKRKYTSAKRRADNWKSRASKAIALYVKDHPK